MQVRLEVAHKKASVKNVVLKKETLIGRGADCNLRIASHEVSRQHCRLRIVGDKVLVRDLGSSNGTFVDGKPIPAGQDVPLQAGAELVVGGIRFVVKYHDETRKAPSPGSTVDIRPEAEPPPTQELPRITTEQAALIAAGRETEAETAAEETSADEVLLDSPADDPVTIGVEETGGGDFFPLESADEPAFPVFEEANAATYAVDTREETKEAPSRSSSEGKKGGILHSLFGMLGKKKKAEAKVDSADPNQQSSTEDSVSADDDTVQAPLPTNENAAAEVVSPVAAGQVPVMAIPVAAAIVADKETSPADSVRMSSPEPTITGETSNPLPNDEVIAGDLLQENPANHSNFAEVETSAPDDDLTNFFSRLDKHGKT